MYIKVYKTLIFFINLVSINGVDMKSPNFLFFIFLIRTHLHPLVLEVNTPNALDREKKIGTRSVRELIAVSKSKSCLDVFRLPGMTRKKT